MPRGGKILQSTWAFKHKRYLASKLKKYKDRLCVRGDHEIDGVDVIERHAPVVSWITVRLLLVLLLVLKLQTQQIDYTNTFFQAPLELCLSNYLEVLNGLIWCYCCSNQSMD